MRSRRNIPTAPVIDDVIERPGTPPPSYQEACKLGKMLSIFFLRGMKTTVAQDLSKIVMLIEMFVLCPRFVYNFVKHRGHFCRHVSLIPFPKKV